MRMIIIIIPLKHAQAWAFARHGSDERSFFTDERYIFSGDRVYTYGTSFERELFNNLGIH